MFSWSAPLARNQSGAVTLPLWECVTCPWALHFLPLKEAEVLHLSLKAFKLHLWKSERLFFSFNVVTFFFSITIFSQISSLWERSVKLCKKKKKCTWKAELLYWVWQNYEEVQSSSESSSFWAGTVRFGLVDASVVRISGHKLRFLFVNMFDLQVVHSGGCGLLWLSILRGQKVASII